MMLDTSADIPISTKLMCNYFKTLVNHFFKILPIRESEDDSLPVYLHSLQVELLGCEGFVPTLSENASYMTLLSILQFLIDNPGAPVGDVRREVFRAISICNKLKVFYTE